MKVVDRRARLEETTATAQAARRQRRILGARLGLCYGVFLLACTWQVVDSKPVASLPLGVVSAPLGAFGITAALVGSVLIWPLVGSCAADADVRRSRYAALSILAVHYASAAYAVWRESQVGWQNLERAYDTARLNLLAAAALYGLGQAAIWFLLWRRSRGMRSTA